MDGAGAAVQLCISLAGTLCLWSALARLMEHDLVKQTAKDFHHFGPNDNKDNLERIAAIGGNALYQAGYKKIGRRLLGSFEPFEPWDGEELRRKRKMPK